MYVFLEMKLRGLIPNIHYHVSVSDLYIPMIGPHIFCSKIGGPLVRMLYIKNAHRNMNIEIGNEATRVDDSPYQ